MPLPSGGRVTSELLSTSIYEERIIFSGWKNVSQHPRASSNHYISTSDSSSSTQSNSLILDINLGAHKDRKEQCLMYINDKGRVFEEEDPLKEKYICTEEGEGLVRC